MIRRFVKRTVKEIGHQLPPDYVSPEVEQRLSLLEENVKFLRNENYRLSMILRHLVADQLNKIPIGLQTRSSFDFQWDKLPKGRFMLEWEDFKNKEVVNYALQFTSLPVEWFKGKSVIDVGCGKGRYSYALSKLGANVLSIDQSDHGLRKTTEACKEFPGHRVMKVNLLEPLPISEQFDLVWSFGVLHHTGDTYGAFQKIAKLVRPGGYIFLMLYGMPRAGEVEDFREVNQYEEWRQKTLHMSLDERLAAITEGMKKHEFRADGEEYIHDYFDAISPTINDLYEFQEIRTWLVDAGFTDIKVSIPHRNHHVIARRPIAD